MGHPLGYRQFAKRSSSSSSSSHYPRSVLMPAQEEDSSWALFQVVSLVLLFGVAYTHSTNLHELGRSVVDHVGEMTNHFAQTLEQSLSDAIPSAPPPSKMDQLMHETMDYLQRAFDN